ncbi:hypothetical protein B0H21DRAFT_826210 [Amylocystis lapponica]|nr:hypothetical protein B0H21DRAFT_826210 [Amylocystis lapponica]
MTTLHAGELHLDLILWMGFSHTMREITEFVGEVDDAAAFEKIEQATIDMTTVTIDMTTLTKERRQLWRRLVCGTSSGASVVQDFKQSW